MFKRFSEILVGLDISYDVYSIYLFVLLIILFQIYDNWNKYRKMFYSLWKNIFKELIKNILVYLISYDSRSDDSHGQYEEEYITVSGSIDEFTPLEREITEPIQKVSSTEKVMERKSLSYLQQTWSKFNK